MKPTRLTTSLPLTGTPQITGTLQIAIDCCPMLHMTFQFVKLFPIIALWVIPWMLAFTWMRRDAERRRLAGKP